MPKFGSVHQGRHYTGLSETLNEWIQLAMKSAQLSVCNEGPTSFVDAFLYAFMAGAVGTPAHTETFHGIIKLKVCQSDLVGMIF